MDISQIFSLTWQELFYTTLHFFLKSYAFDPSGIQAHRVLLLPLLPPAAPHPSWQRRRRGTCRRRGGAAARGSSGSGSGGGSDGGSLTSIGGN